MKKVFCITLLLIPFLSYGNIELYELSKKITKSFDAPVGKVVASANIFGNTTVVVYNGKQVKYDIDIKATASSKENAQKELDRVQILFDDTNNRVTAKTEIKDKSSWTNWSWSDWSWSSKKKSSLEINYTIHVPSGRSLAIGQNYGNVYIPDYSGPVSLDVDYGNIVCKNINNNSKIKLEFGNGEFGTLLNSDMDINYSDIEIESCNTLKINIDYGKLISKGPITNLDVTADYSSFNLENVSQTNIKSDYSNYKFKSLGAIRYSNDYGDLEITTLTGNMNASSDYSTIKIYDATASVDQINIDADYSNLKLNLKDYSYEIKGSYLTFINNSGNDSEEDSNTYRGKKGKGKTFLNIKGDYLKVAFK